jgi:hypothetical protein
VQVLHNPQTESGLRELRRRPPDATGGAASGHSPDVSASRGIPAGRRADVAGGYSGAVVKTFSTKTTLPLSATVPMPT